jgi:hypothetical protein
MRRCLPVLVALVGLLFLTSCAHRPDAGPEPGFTPIFDGATLQGWVFTGQPGEGYKVRDGVIVCEQGTKGNLFTEKEYGDFDLRFEFLFAEPGANNGVGIRAPLEGSASHLGMEWQILEESGAEKKYGALRPEQFHGSVYDCIAANRGALKPPGEWNTEEIIAQGRSIKVIVNGQMILNADLNSVTDPVKIQNHPGLFRPRGHLGFLGHDDHVEFRNLRIKEFASAPTPPNTAPAGFKALFNGRDLAGWQGLLAPPNDNPYKRAQLSPDQLAELLRAANERMARDWRVEQGALVYRGDGFNNLVTAGTYGNFELLCDWKIEPDSDSGIYLRSIPQVQIWAPNSPGNPKHEGSGGLYNNKQGPTGPLVNADKPVGQWNQFQVIMAGDHVHVFLNGQLVVNGLRLDNYWDPGEPIPATGFLELQAHKSVVYFQNVYLRPIP